MENNKANKKTLSIIMPVYGKEPTFVKHNILQIKEMIVNSNVSNEIEFIIVYKNSLNNDLNYDALKEFEDHFIKVIREDSSVKKTKKILTGLDASSGKYVLSIDSHHSLNGSQQVTNLVNFLKKDESDLIFTIPIERDITKNSVDTSKKISSITAGRNILKRDGIMNATKQIDYDIIFHDDWTLGLYLLFNKKIQESSGIKINFM